MPGPGALQCYTSPMQFIKSADGKEGVEAMAKEIATALSEGKRVLWLICGGSNIPLAKRAMDLLRAEAKGGVANLTVGQTDERFGPVGHKDSNWQQMLEAGFDFSDVAVRPILFGGSGEETVERYAKTLAEDFASNDLVVAQFGIGPDGHVAGMLPHTGGLNEERLAFGYDSSPFVRITMTPPAFARVASAYAFAFGESKHEAVQMLQNEAFAIDDAPCKLLLSVPESYLYSDQLP